MKRHLLFTLLCTAVTPLLADSNPVAGEFTYKADALRNVSGGLAQGSTVLHNADLVFNLDLEAMAGIEGGQLSAYLLWNDSNTFSERYAGDLQVVSNIDARNAFRVFELWYEQSLADALSIRFGLYDLNSEFDAIDTGGLFLNSSHGIGPDYSQTGQGGPSIFPSSSLAARLNWGLGPDRSLRYALLDAVPGDPDDTSATRISLGGSDGALHALEYNHVLAAGARLGLGGFLYSKSFETIVQPASGTRRDDGNGGVYVFIDAPLARVASGEMNAFARYGRANAKLNPARAYFGAGIVWTGFVSGRPSDQLGLAIASARMGDNFRRVTNSNDHETTIELTYRARVADWLHIQPDVQYIINPGAEPALDNALVIGVRFEAVYGLN